MTVAVRLPSRKKAAAPGSAELLAWYDRYARVLPWRARKGERTEPYRVWLSEIMLQQTTVKAVAPYFARFVQRWPAVEALAAAKLDDVLRAWAGLGYYARARNLHACARAVVERHGGIFPADMDALRALPGIGDYTAAAVAAIAFDAPAVPVDGNVERVVTRLFAVEQEMPAAKPEIKLLATSLLPPRRSGDFAQALMDLGATICSPNGRPARSVRGPMRVSRIGVATRRRFRARRASAKANCGAARPLSFCAPTAASCCKSARTRVCSPP